MADDLELHIAALGFAKLQAVVQSKLDRKLELQRAIDTIDAELAAAAVLLTDAVRPPVATLLAEAFQPIPTIVKPMVPKVRPCRECGRDFNMKGPNGELCVGCRRAVRAQSARLARLNIRRISDLPSRTVQDRTGT